MNPLQSPEEITIVNYTNAYQKAFRDLNEEWIAAYFKMEAADYKALDHPQEYIINKGGKILVAICDGEPIAVCALIKMNDPDYGFELAKMAVSPKVQGKRIGWTLAQKAIETAMELGARKLYLESNTILEPAISLYRKLGFTEVIGRSTPYERCNIQMELILD